MRGNKLNRIDWTQMNYISTYNVFRIFNLRLISSFRKRCNVSMWIHRLLKHSRVKKYFIGKCFWYYAEKNFQKTEFIGTAFSAFASLSQNAVMSEDLFTVLEIKNMLNQNKS